MRILISAGEASGDMYGAQLIEALRRESTATFFGAGGERMRAAGCDTIVDARDLAVVGITEVVSHLPKILGLFKKLIRAADERSDDQRPDIAIVIDSPAFNWRVARQMHKRGIPVVYYVCPQFWAWRQGRVKLLRKYIDKALVIFPFEEKFYRDRGVDATFVGHPLADLPMPAISRRLCHAIFAESCQAMDHAHARQPPKRSSHELPTIIKAIAQSSGRPIGILLPVARTLEASFLEKLISAEPLASRTFTRRSSRRRRSPRAPPLPRRHRRQRNSYGRGRPYANSVCHGLPGLAGHLCSREASVKVPILRWSI